ncbi:hypothetical protein VTJ49DRAFT_7033 [Mycothermus thermophilus]|uniref:Rhodanese domain-containing protein n=1 Tax=Humicola insolens TaxID=85995 RepID=A0ABR3VHX3_HUMIN
MTPAPELPWHAAYPAPKNEAQGITREEVLAMLKAQLEKQKGSGPPDFLLVDLRRADHEGGTIRGSINLPAQSLYPTIPTLYSVLKAAGVRKVIWYCSSSRGRGPRAASWFSDYLCDQGDGDMQSLVLVNGIKGWATAGPEYTKMMDEYEEFYVHKANASAEWLDDRFLWRVHFAERESGRSYVKHARFLITAVGFCDVPNGAEGIRNIQNFVSRKFGT